jgi:uncharacterized membrane protein SirB2
VIEFYGPIRSVHIAAVLTSGALFLLRALLVQCGRSGWALAATPRFLSYAVDTTLLTAALMLVAILPSAVYANGWLAAKLALLPVYIGLGWLALRGRSRAGRLTAFAGAVLAFGAMYGIARAHDPLGPLRYWTLPGFGPG